MSDPSARHYASSRTASATAVDAASTRPQRRPDPAVVHLRVVKPPGPSPARRRRRIRLASTVAGVFVVAVVFTLVSLHVMLAQNQFRLDRLNAKAAAEQAAYERSRLEVDQLESPARIVGVATSRLGMVAAPSATNLVPAPLPVSPTTAATASSASSAKTASAKTPSAKTPSAPHGDSAAPDWSTVKPQLVPSP